MGRDERALAGRLQNAKTVQLSQSRRFQVPCVVIGTCGVASLQGLRMAFPGSYHIGGAASFVFMLLTILAMLPEQTLVIQRVTVLAAIGMCALAVVRIVTIVPAWSAPVKLADGVGGHEALPFWVLRAAASATLCTHVFTLALAGYMVRQLQKGAQGLDMLRVLWRCLAAQCAFEGLCRVFLFVLFLACEEGDFLSRHWGLAFSLPVHAVVTSAALLPEFRARSQAWLARRRGREDAAVGLAALIGGMPVGQVLEQAKKSFRCVSLDRVSRPALACSWPDPKLQHLSRPARLGEVDAFLTHSWHDPATEKWVALQRWRSGFKARHQREPLVWLDKYCLDQDNVEQNLACLPVFLAGCRKLVVFPGPTYASRLWCIIEILTFLTVGGRVEDIVSLALDGFEMDWSTFDVSNATCVDPQDKTRLLSVLEGFAGTRVRFNKMVQELFSKLEEKVGREESEHVGQALQELEEQGLSKRALTPAQEEERRTLVVVDVLKAATERDDERDDESSDIPRLHGPHILQCTASRVEL